MRPEQIEKLANEKAAQERTAGLAGEIGVAGMAPDNFANQAQTQSPRDRLIQRINWKVDELLAQVQQLREAERIVRYASSESLMILDKLESGGFAR